MTSCKSSLFVFISSATLSSLLLMSITSTQANQIVQQQNAGKSSATAFSYIDPLDEGRAGATHKGKNPHATLTPAQQIEVALQHYRDGRMPQAMVVLGRAIVKFPDSADLYAVRSTINLQENKTTDALADIEKAIKINPQNPLYRVNRSQIYLKFNRQKDALADLDRAIKLNPDLLPAHFNRGSLLAYQGKYQQALEDFNHCIAIQPHLPGPYFNRGSVYRTLGKNAKAKQDIEQFVRIAQEPAWKKAGNDLLKAWFQQRNSDAVNKDSEKNSVKPEKGTIKNAS